MKTLTLSRFICELTLLEYDYVQERASKLAAASFFLALCMNELGHWVNACGQWGRPSRDLKAQGQLEEGVS